MPYADPAQQKEAMRQWQAAHPWKSAKAIDQDWHDRQRVTAMCTCGRRARGLLTVEQARQWHDQHRAQHHPDRVDHETWKRQHRRKRNSKQVRTRELTHGHRRDQQTRVELDVRDQLKYRPGVET